MSLSQPTGAQGAFLWIMAAPASSYSFLDIHICWKEPSEDRIEPPARRDKDA